jgi:L-ascorbate metabolism protein UlaG (beta-lactamase superfamily)
MRLLETHLTRLTRLARLGRTKWILPVSVALLLIGAAGFIHVLEARGATPTVGKLTWFGHSCFLLESAAGARIVMDPIPGNIGYELPANLTADAVTISHEHGDHNNAALLTNKPRIFRGLTADKKGWMRVNEKVKDVAVRSVGVYHDEAQGAQRGLNTVFVYEVGGVRVAHLGDLGHILTDKQLSDIGSVDVVLIPVGGSYTIDARQATRVIDQIRPRLIVIPMHYKTDVLTIKELGPVDAFLAGRPNVRRESASSIAITGLKSRPSAEVVVLGHKAN